MQGGLRAGADEGKHAALVKAFTDMRFGPEHAFGAASDLPMIKMLDAEIADLEQRVRDQIAAIPAARGADADGVIGPGAGTGEDAAVLIAEIGLDMIRFPSPQALVSWAGAERYGVGAAKTVAPSRWTRVPVVLPSPSRCNAGKAGSGRLVRSL